MAREYTKASSKSYTSGIDQNQKRLRKIWEDDEERRLQAEEAAQRKLAEAEQAQKDADKEKSPWDKFWGWAGNTAADTVGTAANKLTHFGTEVVNDIATGFNEKESQKRTDDFMRTTGVDKWDDRESVVGEFLGSLVGGLPESFYDSAKNSTRDIYNAGMVQERSNQQEDARQALQNWKDRPDLMSKTLKAGETADQKIKDLTSIVNGTDADAEKYKGAQQYIQERDNAQAAGDAAMNFINIATLGGGKLVTSAGENLIKGAPKVFEGLGKSNTTRKVVADTMLGTGAAGADAVAKGQEVGPEEAGIGAALAILTHGKGAFKNKQAREAAAKAEAEKTRASEFLTRREQEIGAAQDQLNANAASQKQLRLPAVSDTAKTGMSKRLAEIDDAEQRLASNDPDYLRENDLYDVEGGDKRYKELTTEDPVNMKAQQEASAALREADDQVTYYNKLQVESPYFRQVNRAEASRRQELSRMEEMAQDPELDPRGIQSAIDDINTKYDEKLQNLANKYPEEAMQKPMLDQALEQVSAARMQAEDNLNNLVLSQKDAAFKEANSIAETPSVEKIKAHQEALRAERADIEARQKQAEEFSQTPNKSEADVNKKLQDIADGVSPAPSNNRTVGRLLEQKAGFNEVKTLEMSPDKLKPEDMSVLKESIRDRVKQNISQLNKRLAVGLDKFELISEYMRHRGLNDLGDRYDDAVRATNRAVHEDTKIIKSWHKSAGKHNKTETLFDAANGDAEAYAKLNSAGKEVVDSYKRWVHNLGKKLGLPEEILNRPYISHIVIDNEKVGKFVKLSDELKQVRQKLSSGDGDKASLKRQEAAINKKIDEQLAHETLNFKNTSGEIKDRFLEKRTGSKEYKRDFYLAASAYSHAAHIKLNMEGVSKEMAATANALKDVDEGMVDFLRTQIETIKGTKAGIDKWFDDKLSRAGLPDGLASSAMVKARKVVSLAKLGANVNSVINQALQAASIPGVINIDGAAAGALRAHSMLARRAVGKMTEKDIAIWHKMTREGLFDGDSQLLPESVNAAVGHYFDKTMFIGIRGADRYLRLITYLGAQKKGEKIGLSGNDLDRYAWRMTNKANQNFSKLVAPQAFRSQTAKTMGSMMTWLPGYYVRAAEVGMGALRGVKDATVVGHSKLTGKPITAGQGREAYEAITKALWMGVATWGISTILDEVNGQGDVVPNPFNQQSWGTPITNFFTGTSSKAGVMGLMPGPTDKLSRDDNGNIVNESLDERRHQFFTDTLWSFTVPGYSQGKRIVDGIADNERGYAESAKGKVQFVNNPENDLKRVILGKYSTDEGKEYTKGLSTPEGGPLSKQDTETFKSVPKELRNQYYDFFKSSDTLSGRPEADSEVSQLYREGKVHQARRKAAEYNAKVDKAMSKFYSEYKYIDPDIQEELSENLYITLTRRGEKQRANSKDN